MPRNTAIASRDSVAAGVQNRSSMLRGWIVVASAFTIMFVTFGVAYSFSAFFASLEETFHASRASVSLIFSIGIPLYFALGAISGPLADRLGPRGICLFGCIVGGLGLVYASQATALWQVYLGFGIGVGIGVGFSYVPSLATVQRWFVRHRGFASGVAVSGIGLGTLIMPLVAAPLIDHFGWREAWIALGVSMMAIGGIASLFVYSSPEHYGLRPDGDGIAPSKPYIEKAPRLWNAITSRTFLLLYLALVAISIGAFTPFVHLVPFAEDIDLTPGTAVFILGLIGVGSTAGRFLVGGVADRIGRRNALISVFVGLFLMQLWWLAASSAWQLAVFALVFGACYGGFVALYPALTVDHFGTQNASAIIGILYTGCSFGTFVGPLMAGMAFDAYKSYMLPISAGAVFALFATALIYLTSSPRLSR